MTLIDGKAIAEQVKQEIAAEVAEILAKGGKQPHLAAILVGHDGGSETYVAAKVKACEVCGFKSTLIRYEADVTEEELLNKVRELNQMKILTDSSYSCPCPNIFPSKKLLRRLITAKMSTGSIRLTWEECLLVCHVMFQQRQMAFWNY